MRIFSRDGSNLEQVVNPVRSTFYLKIIKGIKNHKLSAQVFRRHETYTTGQMFEDTIKNLELKNTLSLDEYNVERYKKTHFSKNLE